MKYRIVLAALTVAAVTLITFDFALSDSATCYCLAPDNDTCDGPNLDDEYMSPGGPYNFTECLSRTSQSACEGPNYIDVESTFGGAHSGGDGGTVRTGGSMPCFYFKTCKWDMESSVCSDSGDPDDPGPTSEATPVEDDCPDGCVLLA